MSTWGQQLVELTALKKAAPDPSGDPNAASPHDKLRRKYLTQLHAHTGRAIIVYATPWLENKEAPGESLSLNLGDKQGFMEAVSNIHEKELDLIITSPGGSPEAAESIMGYLRTRFDHIRAVIPVAAMSAATMVALACDEILMGTQSQLGPIDPQFTVYTPEGPRQSAGQAIIDQFEMAKEQLKDPANLAAWMPLLRALLPGLLATCEHSRQMAEKFVADQLALYMLKGDPIKATAVAHWFADFSYFKSHARPVTMNDVRDQGLNVTAMEDDQVLQDLVLSVHHAVRHTFSDTPTIKLIENHHGRAYIEMVQTMIAGPIPQGRPGSPITPGSPFAPRQPELGGNRAQRRRDERKK